MNKEEKNIMIGELTEKLTNNSIIYLADVSELSVENTGKLRRSCFKQNVSLNVVKNTLLRKAMENVEGKDFSASVLHGDMMQKEREQVMEKFRTGNTRILITTDIMARGIDVQQVSIVINYDMPKYPQTYIHRIGRSGRFGRKGCAVNFVTRKEKNILQFIQKLYSTTIHEFPANVSEVFNNV